ncbi:MAG TPA: four helix bundle protein [Bryobacteraceae bacterium]|nr:four helix bundle protein [Bryobacteraceae bacterium]
MQATAKNFQGLLVWQKAHKIVLGVYQMTASFPRHEMFGLSSQLQRAAVSVPANIAEGFKRRGKADKARFLNIAQASLEECRYYLILSQDLGYSDTACLLALLDETSRFLDKYLHSLSSSSPSYSFPKTGTT